MCFIDIVSRGNSSGMLMGRFQGYFWNGSRISNCFAEIFAFYIRVLLFGEYRVLFLRA